MADSRYEKYQYIYGNTVRAVEVPVQEEIERKERRARQQQRERQQVRSNRAVLEFDARFAMTMAMAVLAVVVICLTYLYGQNVLNDRSKAVASKRTKLATLTSENQAVASNLEKKTDLDEIKSYAKKELGMVEPTEKSTIYYEGTPSDYVRQYADIGSTE